MERKKARVIFVPFLYKENHSLDEWFGGSLLAVMRKKPPFVIIRSGLPTEKQKEDIQMGLNDINSLSHTKWNCKYHIVFAPKYRRKVFYKEHKAAIGKILRELCEWKGVRIIEAEICPDHVHMFVEIPPKISISNFMGYLKGKSSTMLYEQFGDLKYKYRNREFWCRGYYVDTVGKNENRIAEYIRNQLKEDQLGEQMSMPGFNPFTGSGK